MVQRFAQKIQFSKVCIKRKIPQNCINMQYCEAVRVASKPAEPRSRRENSYETAFCSVAGNFTLKQRKARENANLAVSKMLWIKMGVKYDILENARDGARRFGSV